MNNLNFKIVGNSRMDPVCVIDGNNITLTKNKFGNLEGSFQTEKDEVQVTMFSYLELGGKFWWLMSILFFIISIFGLFNPPYDKKCLKIDYNATIKLKDNSDIVFKINNQKHADKAILVESVCEVVEGKNNLVVDKVVKRRLRIISLCKLLAWIGVIILAILYIV